MSSIRDRGHLLGQLHDVAAELDAAVRQVRVVEDRVRSSIGSTATGADKRMLSALSQVSGSARGAQQAASAAAGRLRNLG
jgi:hypothetical protein